MQILSGRRATAALPFVNLITPLYCRTNSIFAFAIVIQMATLLSQRSLKLLPKFLTNARRRLHSAMGAHSCDIFVQVLGSRPLSQHLDVSIRWESVRESPSFFFLKMFDKAWSPSGPFTVWHRSRNNRLAWADVPKRQKKIFYILYQWALKRLFISWQVFFNYHYFK